MNIDNKKILWITESNINNIFFFKKASFFDIMPATSYNILKFLLNFSQNMNKIFKNINFPKRIYIKRINRRKLLIHDSFFKKYGFQIIIAENYCIKDQIRFSNANVVFCPHGAGVVSCIYMSEHTTLIETFNNAYINPCCMPIIAKLNINYHMIVESNLFINSSTQASKDYFIDMCILENTLSQIL